MADFRDSMLLDDIETIADNSFRNFHAKGLDYLCLQRSEQLTVKAYFYRNGDGRSPEVVCPHDHRYPFSTTLLTGASGHFRYEQAFGYGTAAFQRFDWRTPLLGGSGFEWREEVHLRRTATERYKRGDSYWCAANEIHTISILEPGTILFLVQLADVVPPDEPTATYVGGQSQIPPSIDGLYDRMTVDHARALLAEITHLSIGGDS